MDAAEADIKVYSPEAPDRKTHDVQAEKRVVFADALHGATVDSVRWTVPYERFICGGEVAVNMEVSLIYYY